MADRVMLDSSEINLMQHALGIKGPPPWAPYRNRYITKPGGEAWAIWERLEADGFACKYEAVDGDLVWAVTDEGIEQLGIDDLSGLEARERHTAPSSTRGVGNARRPQGDGFQKAQP